MDPDSLLNTGDSFEDCRNDAVASGLADQDLSSHCRHTIGVEANSAVEGMSLNPLLTEPHGMAGVSTAHAKHARGGHSWWAGGAQCIQSCAWLAVFP